MIELIKFIFGSWMGRIIIIGLFGPLLFYVFQAYMKLDSLSLNQGTVISTTHHPEGTRYVAGANHGKGGTSRGTMVKQPEKWTLVIEGHDSKGKLKQRELKITQKEFSSIKIGSTYSLNEQ